MANEQEQTKDNTQNVLNNDILNELKQNNEKSDKLISLIQAQEENRLKDKETQDSKNAEIEKKNSEVSAKKEAKSAEDLKVQQASIEVAVTELKTSNEKLDELIKSNDNSLVISELKENNKQLSAIVESQKTSNTYDSNQLSVSTLILAGLLVAVGGYFLIKFTSLFVSKISRMFW